MALAALRGNRRGFSTLLREAAAAASGWPGQVVSVGHRGASASLQGWNKISADGNVLLKRERRDEQLLYRICLAPAARSRLISDIVFIDLAHVGTQLFVGACY